MCFTSLRDNESSIVGSSTTASSESFMHKTKYGKDSGSDSLTDPKFLIVGAGAAGIACAVTLIKKGFQNVCIVEAEKRIGGRIFTKPFGQNIIELGAQWCHGQKDNIVYEMVDAKQMIRSSSYIYANFDCIRSNGEIVSHVIVEKLKKILAQIFVQGKQEMPKFNGSLGDYLEKKFNEILNDEHTEIDRDIASEFLENFAKIERSETASNLEDISAKGFQIHGNCDGDYLLYFKEGYSQFLRILMEADEDYNDFGLLEDKILVGVSVREIIWDRPDYQVEVICDNLNVTFLVDHVILTVSLGVLKKNANQMFYPELPASKLRAIDGLGFGNILKIYLEFPTHFWNPKWTGLIMLWRQADIEELRKGSLAWLENIYGFYRVPNQSKVLVGWLVGEVITTVENMPDTEVMDGCVYLLKRFLPQTNIPNPIAISTSKWNTNPNFCGAYSFHSLKTEEVGTSAAELRQPITVLAQLSSNIEDPQVDEVLTVKPVLLFAGEATHDKYFGTVHGAVESGIEEARRLEGYYSAIM